MDPRLQASSWAQPSSGRKARNREAISPPQVNQSGEERSPSQKGRRGGRGTEVSVSLSYAISMSSAGKAKPTQRGGVWNCPEGNRGGTST